MPKRKGLLVVPLALSLLLGLSSVATAAGMSGMDMGGMDMNSSQPQISGPSQTNPSSVHEAMPGMDPNMPGMQSTSPAQSIAGEAHKAEAGMDPNMPGMQSSEENATPESSGVDWPVVDGFALINLLVIGTAGVLKLKGKIRSQL